MFRPAHYNLSGGEKVYVMNFIYSITNRTSSAFRGMLMLVMGLALLIWPSTMLNFIVKIIAAFLIAVGAITFYCNMKVQKEQEKDPASNGKETKDILRAFATLNVAIYLLFGILIFIFPGFFVSILVFLFGAILLFLGLGQLVNLFVSSRHTQMPAYLYIVPIVVTLCGVILFFQPFTAKDVLTMFFGGCLAVYGLEEVISSWMLRKVKFGRDGKFVHQNTGSAEPLNKGAKYSSAEEVPFEEVGDGK